MSAENGTKNPWMGESPSQPPANGAFVSFVKLLAQFAILVMLLEAPVATSYGLWWLLTR